MGVWTDWRRLLASADLAFVDVGSKSLWSESRGVSLHECSVSRRQRRIAFSVATDVDGGVVAECGGGGTVCPASAARGVGGVGDGTQGCAQRLLRLAGADMLRPLCATENAESGGTRHATPVLRSFTAEGGRNTQDVSHFTSHVSRLHLLSSLPLLLCLWPDEQGDAGDLALCDASARLLAAGENAECSAIRSATHNTQHASRFTFHVSRFTFHSSWRSFPSWRCRRLRA